MRYGLLAASMGLYPPDVRLSIQGLARTLDDLISTSPDVATTGGTDPYGPLSALNARLVNDVILKEGSITPAEANARLSSILADAATLESAYSAAGISTHGRAPVDSDAIVQLTPAQAQRLMIQFGNAMDLYTPAVDRYLAARQAASSAFGLPSSGLSVAELVAPIDQRVGQLDVDSNQVLDDSEVIRQGAGGKDLVEIGQGAYDRMLNWIANVYVVNEALKRVEALAQRTPASPTPAAADSKTPVVLIAFAGLLLVGLAFYAAMD